MKWNIYLKNKPWMLEWGVQYSEYDKRFKHTFWHTLFGIDWHKNVRGMWLWFYKWGFWLRY